MEMSDESDGQTSKKKKKRKKDKSSKKSSKVLLTLRNFKILLFPVLTPPKIATA